MIPKAREVEKCLFCVSDLKETEDTGVSLSYIVWVIFRLCPGHESNVEEKFTRHLDLPIYGKANSANFISVKDGMTM